MNEENAQLLKLQFHSKEKYALLKIELTDNLFRKRFFLDPNAESCFYTLETISPKEITIIKKDI